MSVTIGEGTCVRATEKAICVQFTEGGASRQLWIPQSQVHDDSEVWRMGDSGKVVVTQWWAIERGLAAEEPDDVYYPPWGWDGEL